MVSVKSAAPVPKGEMFTVMERIHETTVEAPVAIGDVIIDDICGTQIVATKEIR
jgi:CxxC motif-containing protein